MSGRGARGATRGLRNEIIGAVGRHAVDRKKNAVVGDITYSRCRKLLMDLPGQALHAFQLGLDHPIEKERMLFEGPTPPVMEKLLSVLRKRSTYRSASSVPGAISRSDVRDESPLRFSALKALKPTVMA